MSLIEKVRHRLDDLEKYHFHNTEFVRVRHRLDDLENALHAIFIDSVVRHRLDDLEMNRSYLIV